MPKKRANGEGSIRRRPSGSWEGRYTLGIDPITGKAIQKSISAKTQAECRAKLSRAIQENRGIPLHQHTSDPADVQQVENERTHAPVQEADASRTF